MEHVVFFPAQDGSPAFRRVGSLEEAVRLVEHLRNMEGVQEVSCHALTEVPLAFRAYYRVEVPAPAEAAFGPAAPALQPSVPIQVTPDPAAELLVPPPTEPIEAQPHAAEVEPALLPEPAMTSMNGHASEGAKSLGFFA